jgi:hypothetical protein
VTDQQEAQTERVVVALEVLAEHCGCLTTATDVNGGLGCTHPGNRERAGGDVGPCVGAACPIAEDVGDTMHVVPLLEGLVETLRPFGVTLPAPAEPMDFVPAEQARAEDVAPEAIAALAETPEEPAEEPAPPAMTLATDEGVVGLTRPRPKLTAGDVVEGATLVGGTPVLVVVRDVERGIGQRIEAPELVDAWARLRSAGVDVDALRLFQPFAGVWDFASSPLVHGRLVQASGGSARGALEVWCEQALAIAEGRA